jgi:predicted lactoylglutathione lyase
MMQPSRPSVVVEPILNSIAAHLFVQDIGASCKFFQSKLGFGVDFVYGDPPFYGQVSRDNVKLALRHMDEPVFVRGIREREDLVLASITVASAKEIQQLFLTYQAAGVPFHQTLRREPWGAETFIVKDPDGNLILFAGPAS